MGIISFLFFASIYFLPYIVARIRNKKNIQAIAIANVFLGWTGIGWIGCMIWSFLED